MRAGEYEFSSLLSSETRMSIIMFCNKCSVVRLCQILLSILPQFSVLQSLSFYYSLLLSFVVYELNMLTENSLCWVVFCLVGKCCKIIALLFTCLVFSSLVFIPYVCVCWVIIMRSCTNYFFLVFFLLTFSFVFLVVNCENSIIFLIFFSVLCMYIYSQCIQVFSFIDIKLKVS